MKHFLMYLLIGAISVLLTLAAIGLILAGNPISGVGMWITCSFLWGPAVLLNAIITGFYNEREKAQ
jgi:hypothetical protein